MALKKNGDLKSKVLKTISFVLSINFANFTYWSM